MNFSAGKKTNVYHNTAYCFFLKGGEKNGRLQKRTSLFHLRNYSFHIRIYSGINSSLN